MMMIPLLLSQVVVWDFFHQQYVTKHGQNIIVIVPFFRRLGGASSLDGYFVLWDVLDPTCASALYFFFVSMFQVESGVGIQN